MNVEESGPPRPLTLPQGVELAADYDEDVAIRNIDIAALSYCTPDQIKSNENRHSDNLSDFTATKVWTNSSLQFYVGYDESTNAVALAVRGSETLSNWIDNIDALKTEPWNDGIKVHSGFYSEYQTLRDPMSELVSEEMESRGTDKLLIAGHSSGAANGILFAYEVSQGYIPSLSSAAVSSLHTFGCPRVGSDEFVQAFAGLELPHHRVVHYKDLVPHLPMHSMGFRHTPVEVWYYQKDSNEYRVCDGSGEDPECSYSVKMGSASDHCSYIGMDICGC